MYRDTNNQPAHLTGSAFGATPPAPGDADDQPSDTSASTTALAVTYLRVSTKEQATRGGQEEGFSIPAQREANTRKAESIGARIVAEFVDAGESAKSADRPELMKMIQYVKQHRVSYCIVHKVDRLARSRNDDVAIHLALREAGVMLVSATENIDETPSGMLLHGIMSSIAEFYSRNLASEVVKGMTQKAQAGGTPGKAPIGYLNRRRIDEQHREVRYVELDPERAPLVKWAFYAYATGEWSVRSIQRELELRGLTSVPTPKYPSSKLAPSAVYNMLTRPYYKGTVTYAGKSYQGTHEQLVPPEVWYQVQTLLQNHALSGDRTQKHHHYLKGTLFCGQCGSRLIIVNAKSRSGDIYPYFACGGRQTKRTECTRSAIGIPKVERMVEDYYSRVQISPETQLAVRESVSAEFDQRLASGKEELDQLVAHQTQLKQQQRRLLDAHLSGAVSLELLKEKQAEIELELQQVKDRVDAHMSDYADAKAYLHDCLWLLGDCATIYENGDGETRRLCNLALFDRIYIDGDDEARFDLRPEVGFLVDPATHAAAREGRSLADGVMNMSVVQTNATGWGYQDLNLGPLHYQ